MSVYSDPSMREEHNGVQAIRSRLGEDPKKSKVYTSNYVLLVLEVMQGMGLQPIEDTMQTEAKLMDVTAEMQSDLTTIQEYLTRIENLSHSGGSYRIGNTEWKPGDFPSGQNGWSGPNSANGLAWDEFHENPNVNTSESDDYCAADLKNATDGFIAAMKDLFEAQPCQEGDPMAGNQFLEFSVNKIDKKTGLVVNQKVDLGGEYNKLNSDPKGWGVLGSNGGSVFTTSDSHRATLIQQYTFYKYKLAAEQYNGLIPGTNPEWPDITQLGFDMDPESTSFNGVGKSLYGVLNSFNTTVETHRQNDGSMPDNGKLSNKSGNFLDYIFRSDPYAFYASGSSYWAGRTNVNIVGAFSYAAFNYFWTKNPNASTSSGDMDPTHAPTPYNDSEAKHGHDDYNVDDKDKGVVSDGDKLSNWYSTSQSSSSILSSSSSEASTTMQQYSSEVSQYQNIGQNIIKSASENNIATVQNFKSG